MMTHIKIPFYTNWIFYFYDMFFRLWGHSRRPDYCGFWTEKFLKLGQDTNWNFDTFFQFLFIDWMLKENWFFVEKNCFLLLVPGGIFHEDNYNSEIAFRCAIDRVNLLEKNFELVPVVHRVSKTDSYKTERIGEWAPIFRGCDYWCWERAKSWIERLRV